MSHKANLNQQLIALWYGVKRRNNESISERQLVERSGNTTKLNLTVEIGLDYSRKI